MANGDAGEAALREALILESAATLQRVAMKRDGGKVVVSRATWLRDTALFENATVLPVVGGQTIWSEPIPGAEYVTVVEQPNYFGRFEMNPPTGPGVVPIQWWPSRDGPRPADPTADGPQGDVEAARHLATGLRSIRGVRLLHGPPEAPWFVVSLPVSAEVAVAALRGSGFAGCRALGKGFPEFPGGMHLQVAWPRRDNGSFIAVVRGAIEDLKGQ